MAEDYPPWLMSPMSLEKPSREMITSDGKTTRALMQGAGDDMATRERAAESAAGGHECVSNQKKNPGIGGNPDGNRGTSGDALLQQRQGQGQGPSEGSFKENVDQGNAFLASEPKEEDTVVKELPVDEAEDIEDPVTKCKQCGTTWTPLWRTFGSEILCNACGLRRIRSRNGSGSKKRGRKKKKGMPAPKSTLKSSSYPRKPKVKSIFQTSKQLQSDTTGEIRRGKRERKTNTWFQQYETDLHHPQDENETSSEENGMELLAHEGGRKGKENQDYRSRSLSVVIPRRSHHHHSRKQSAARKEMVQDEDVKEACEALAAMDDRGDDSPESTSKSEELDLSDGEVDLILKLHDVYGPYKQSLLSDTIKRPECSTITLAIVLRGAQNLSRVGKISSPEKMWLLQKIASDDDSYLKSLPVACSNYDELEDLLYQFVLKERGESIEKASSFNVTQIDQKQPEVQVLPSSVIHEPTTTPKMVPPPLYINEGIMADNYLNDIVKKLIVHTPKLEEEAPRLHLNFM